MNRTTKIIYTVTTITLAAAHSAKAENPCIQSYQPSTTLDAGLRGPQREVTDSTDVVNKILNAVGGFRIQVFAVTGLGNACAARPHGERVVYYDDAWLKSYSKDKYWITVGVLAHEVGHLINDHRRDDGLNAWRKEYEADFFVGRVVSILGGSIENAQEAVSFQPVDASEFYPSRASRLSAVEEGFNRTQTANAKPKETNARYRTCSLPVFGEKDWQNQEPLSGTSGWRNGGYNQNAYCTEFINSIVGSRKLSGTVYKLERTGSSEEDRKTGFAGTGPHQYNYHCSVKLSTVPIYNERADERCGPL